MKGKFKLIVVVFVITIGIGSYLYNLSRELSKSYPDNLKNVEALIWGGGMVEYACYGSGNVACPNGSKVKYYINNF